MIMSRHAIAPAAQPPGTALATHAPAAHIAVPTDIVQDVEHALWRARSPYTVTDWLRWLTSGQLSMAVGEYMHASLWHRPDGVAEIAHVSGIWNVDDVQWLMDRMRDAVAERGAEFVEINGRIGWARMLRMHRISTCIRRRN